MTNDTFIGFVELLSTAIVSHRIWTPFIKWEGGVMGHIITEDATSKCSIVEIGNHSQPPRAGIINSDKITTIRSPP